jgi:hypothetical protein
MQLTTRRPKIVVSADGTGIVSQAGGLLPTQTLRAAGLDCGLTAALQRWRPPRAAHDPGKIITDLAAALALGGDCLADVAMLRAQPELFGLVASDPVVSRLVARLAADAPAALKAIRAARAAARQRAWELAGDAAPGADGTLIGLFSWVTGTGTRDRALQRESSLYLTCQPSEMPPGWQGTLRLGEGVGQAASYPRLFRRHVVAARTRVGQRSAFGPGSGGCNG